jgi:hypothetical protein
MIPPTAAMIKNANNNCFIFLVFKKLVILHAKVRALWAVLLIKMASKDGFSAESGKK